MHADDEPQSAWDRAMRDHEAKLVIGARVISRFESECIWEEHERASHFDQRTGTIWAIEPLGHPGTTAHRFLVQFDDEPQPQRINRLAAAELIPIGDERAPTEGEG